MTSQSFPLKLTTNAIENNPGEAAALVSPLKGLQVLRPSPGYQVAVRPGPDYGISVLGVLLSRNNCRLIIGELSDNDRITIG